MLEGLQALNVLVVDDNAQMRTIVGTVLSAAGVGRLYYATDGAQGLAMLGKAPIDLVYVDYEMPRMNGLDFISALRGRESQDRYMPVIMLTGYAEPTRIAMARDRGVTEFLCKPVSASAILTRLNAVIVHQRPFINIEGYFGPDRRRRRDPEYRGARRRSADVGVAEI
jgi:CheY-like chemotaxis protein